MPSLTDQRRALRHSVEDATEKLRQAKRRVDREDRLHRELTSELFPFPAKKFSPAHLRRYTEKLLAQVQEQGLAFGPAEGSHALRLVDPVAREEFAAARERHRSAIQAVKQFDDAHAKDLEREAAAEEAERIRETLQGDDPDAIRDAVLGRNGNRNVLTSRDFEVASR